jgi:hypothetical protein
VYGKNTGGEPTLAYQSANFVDFKRLGEEKDFTVAFAPFVVINAESLVISVASYRYCPLQLGEIAQIIDRKAKGDISDNLRIPDKDKDKSEDFPGDTAEGEVTVN